MPAEFRAPDLIGKKRDGRSLTDTELEQFVKGVVNGDVTDSQTGAMLMAIYLNGLSDAETATLTLSMLKSGDVLSWPDEWKGMVVDKHSTGGVGEKTSLILTPALAACGLKVPMITGRGLGHTGGTLDKLEAIPGFNTRLSIEGMKLQLEQVGAFIVGPTKQMVPADGILYTTRDITGTVENKSLIAASIMSKKLAESLDALVILVTFGRASFMKTEQQARELSELLIDIGRRRGVTCSCMIMRMDDPLGRTVGNALEIRETIRCLNGDGPGDLHDVVCRLGAQLLVSCGRAGNADDGYKKMDKVIKDGSARRKFIEIATAQHTDAAILEKMFRTGGDDVLPTATNVTSIGALSSGYIHGIDAKLCGILAHQQLAGRVKVEDTINMAVGMDLCACVGDFIKEGEPWVKIHHDLPLTEEKLSFIQSIITIRTDPLPSGDIERILDILDASNCGRTQSNGQHDVQNGGTQNGH